MDEQRADALTGMIRSMVDSRDDLRALAVCGSWARGNSRPDSDLDLLILAEDPAVWRRDQGWVENLAFGRAGCVYRSHVTKTYGVAWSAHVLLRPGTELELTFAPLSWAHIDPVDRGTRDVVADGFTILVDKDGALAQLFAACSKPSLKD